MTISALVVDDEPIARHAIVRLLRADPEIELLDDFANQILELVRDVADAVPVRVQPSSRARRTAPSTSGSAWPSR